MLEDKILVVENCVSSQLASFVDAELKAPALQWQYAANVTGDSYQGTNPGFADSPFANGAPANTAYWFLYPLLLEAAGKQNIVVEQLLRIRVGAYVNRGTKQHNNIHVDSPEPHIVGLYYPHDSDGDTVFFSAIDGGEELLRVSPKRGTMVFFNGRIPHASSNPVERDVRVTVNYNFAGQWPE
jgi:hypothetical protein